MNQRIVKNCFSRPLNIPAADVAQCVMGSGLVWILHIGGGRIAGTYEKLEPMMDQFRDFDISCGQPPHLEKFYEDFYDYSCKNGWCTVQEYYNNVYIKEVA